MLISTTDIKMVQISFLFTLHWQKQETLYLIIYVYTFYYVNKEIKTQKTLYLIIYMYIYMLLCKKEIKTQNTLFDYVCVCMCVCVCIHTIEYYLSHKK